MAGLDLTSRAGALRFAELRRNEAHREFSMYGKLERSPIFYVFGHYMYERAPKPTPDQFVVRGKKLDRIEAIPCPVPPIAWNKLGDRTTAYAGALIKAIAKVTEAIGVLTIMEAWGVFDDRPDNAENRADVDGRPYGWIAAADGKIEALYASLEHRALPHPWRWTAQVHRDPVLLVDAWDGGEMKRPESPGSNRLSEFVDWRS